MNARKNQEGQAIVEMTVSMIGMAAIFCGLILVAKLTTSNIDNILLARGDADENGNTITLGDQGDPILCWDAGADQYQYSPDDISMNGTSEDSANFKGQLVVRNVDASDFKIDSSAPTYVDSGLSFRNLRDISLFLSAAELTAGSSSKNVSIDDMPLASELFLNNPNISTINLEDTLYMPFMKDIP